MQTTQTLIKVRQPEPVENLVESIPVQDGIKLSQTSKNDISWKDLRGLTWIFDEEW